MTCASPWRACRRHGRPEGSTTGGRPTTPGFPRNRPCQNCPLSLWERVGVREPRGEQAGVNGNEWERQGYWGPSPGLRPPSPRGRGVGFGTGRTGLRPPSPRGRGVRFGTDRTGLRPPSPRGRFGTGRTGLRPPSPRGRGVGFGTGRTGLRPPSPRGRGVEFGTGRTGLRPPSPRGRGVEFDTACSAGMTETERRSPSTAPVSPCRSD